MPGNLAQKLVTEFEQLQQAHPYVPYGAHVKRQAEELLAKSKRGQRKPTEPWNFRNQFSDDELRLILENSDFARQMLKTYEPTFKNREPAIRDIHIFQDMIKKDEGSRLFPNIDQNYFWNNIIKRQNRLPSGEAARIRESSLARINENREAAKKADLMLGQSSRLAPLSPLHTTAKEMIRRNNPTESIRLGREEITAAGRTNVPREIEPYLRQASETPAAFIQQYEMSYAPLISKFRREASRDFLEHDLPTINNHFAHKGAFHSSAREAALDKAKRRKEERIEGEVARLLLHGREEAMKHYHQQRTGHLRQAEIAGHAHQAKQDSHLRAAEALRVNSGAEQALIHQQAAALGQMARTEQQQAQNELNVRQQEHREEMERPFIQHMRKAAIGQGTPQPHPQFSPEAMNPPPPNVYGLGSGLIGQMAGLMGQQPHYPQHASGGHVRRGYAAGDSVSRAASQLQEMRNHTQESPEEAEMRQSAQSFKNYRANPMADYLFTLGSHQLANLGGSPMKSYGEGSLLGMRAYKAAEGANLSAQEKYNNLMHKINQSKMDQHSFLAKHHALMQQQEEALRHHKAQESESMRGHNIMRDIAMKKMKNAERFKVDVSGVPVKKSATEVKLESDAKKDLLRALRMKKELGHLGELVKQTSTGPVIGGIKSVLPKTKIDNQIEVSTNKLILDMHQGMKNIPRSEEFLKRIETTKPNRSNYAEANEQALSLMSQGADDVLEHSISTLLSAGWTPEKIEKQFKIKVPDHFLEEGEGDQEQHGEEGDIAQGNMISMVDPDGNPLMVPEGQVDEALKLGATVAQ